MSLKSLLSLSSIAILLAGCAHVSQEEHPVSKTETSVPPEQRSQYVFGWGMMPSELATPAGGTTRGADVELAAPEKSLVASRSSTFDKDRAAILALAGNYKVDFHFMEALGLTDSFKPSQRYNSWGTEHVQVLEDRGHFVSLQHTLVMFFEDEDGVSEPMVMKHWRQDWTYEDNIIFTFQGDLTWNRHAFTDEEVAGTWSQAVFQVDDSPRYEVVGHWQHHGNLSRWISQMDARPLPRREFAQRSDYRVLEGTHQIILTPTGWVHEQDNWKRIENVSEAADPTYLAQEIGINRYERIVAPDVATPSNQYWEQTGEYWAAVRKVWRELISERDAFALHSKVNGQSQFSVHFQQAETKENVEQTARESVMSFVK